MIDIHHHLLPNLDDGARTLEESVEMVGMAVEDGITHIVATPHANDRYRYDRERNSALLDEVRGSLPPDIRSRITLGLGCDFHLNWENIRDAHTHRRRYTINATDYLLIELPDTGIPARLEEVLYSLRVDGLIPILTHPERNLTLQRTPERLLEWVSDGLLLQVTAGSLTGAFGPTAEKMGWNLVKKRWAQFLATDAHGIDRRPPRMSDARTMVAHRLDEAAAQRLCVTNPLAVFNGTPLPPQPLRLGLPGAADEDEYDEESRSLWSRLFRR